MIAWERSTVARNQTVFPPGLRCFNKMQFISSALKEHLSTVLNSGNFPQPSATACFHPGLWRKRLYPWRKKKKKKKKQAQKKCHQFHFQDERGFAISSGFSTKPLQLETTQCFPQQSIWWNTEVDMIEDSPLATQYQEHSIILLFSCMFISIRYWS